MIRDFLFFFIHVYQLNPQLKFMKIALFDIKIFDINPMHPALVIIAMVNGMIGGVILVLPLLALQAGTVISFFVILGTGALSFYSCYLCVLHLGNHSDLDKAILYHFNQSKFMKISYDLLVFVNLTFLLMLYFDLIVQQWLGLVPNSIAIPICNGFLLFGLCFLLNYFHFGAKLLGYGIISIIGYCIFLIWLIASAPSGEKTVGPTGSGQVNMAASMGQAFAIQTFFIPVLKELPDPKSYWKYVLTAYIIGSSVYVYIGYMGSFGIVNRPLIVNPPQTVEDYFQRGNWQVSVLDVIYLIHLYSAFPQFLLICKKRFFSIFNLQQSKQGQILKVSEAALAFSVIAICFGIYMAQISIDNLIQINGAVIGFFFIYFLPALLHIKCLYFCCETNEDSQQVSMIQNLNGQPKQIELQTKTMELKNLQKPYLEGDGGQNNYETNRPDNNASRTDRVTNPNISNVGQLERHISNMSEVDSTKPLDLRCHVKRPQTWRLVVDWIMLIAMIGLGAFIMVDGIISVIDSI